MSRIGAAPCAVPAINARAEASRRNGARSHGPNTPEGKARSAQNALKHGFRAQKHVVLASEDAAEFAALEAALIEELAPDGALQAVLAQRVVAATWRLARAERLEADLFAENHLAGRSLGLALIRDCNTSRSFETLLRYRGATLAELWRALRTLKALQAERAAMAPGFAAPTPELTIGKNAAPAAIPMAPEPAAGEGQRHAQPIEPKGGGNPDESEPAPMVSDSVQQPGGSVQASAGEPAAAPARLQRCPLPDEPEGAAAAAAIP